MEFKPSFPLMKRIMRPTLQEDVMSRKRDTQVDALAGVLYIVNTHSLMLSFGQNH